MGRVPPPPPPARRRIPYRTLIDNLKTQHYTREAMREVNAYIHGEPYEYRDFEEVPYVISPDGRILGEAPVRQAVLSDEGIERLKEHWSELAARTEYTSLITKLAPCMTSTSGVRVERVRTTDGEDIWDVKMDVDDPRRVIPRMIER